MNKIFLILTLILFCAVSAGYPQSIVGEPDQDSVAPSPVDEESAAKRVQQFKSQFETANPLITVFAGADKTRITIGEKIQYRIEIRAAKSIQIEFPDFGESLGGFAITDFSVTGPDKDGEYTRWIREYTLDVYVSGAYVIPPARITYRLSNGEPQTVFAPPVFVDVKSILPGENIKLKDIKPVVEPELKISAKAIMLGSIALIIILGIGAGICAWWLRRKNYAPPPRPAHLIALEALEDIKSRGLVEAGLIKEYYFLISNVLRHYIENRFGLMAPERTTEEFLSELNRFDILEPRHKEILAQFLTHCDMVKFAKYSPGADEIGRVFVTAQDFINETKPAQEQPEYEEDEDDADYDSGKEED